jgi:hypothetical protein
MWSTVKEIDHNYHSIFRTLKAHNINQHIVAKQELQWLPSQYAGAGFLTPKAYCRGVAHRYRPPVRIAESGHEVLLPCLHFLGLRHC